MRDDFELGFGMRHPTDLRDRFRIRYPGLFSQAGYKLKQKEERMLRGRANESETQEANISTHRATGTSKILSSSDDTMVHVRNDTSTSDAVATTTSGVPSITHLVPLNTTLQLDSLRPTLDTMTALTFDDEEDDDRSPIILNRNILQWADENSSSLLPTTALGGTQVASHAAGDTPYNPFTASDGLHINPLVTLKLPSTAQWNYMTSSSMAPPPSLPPPGPLKHTLAATSQSTSGSRSTPDMRAPNLPNIVFPYVPNASARNAVHNLPPPADILSSGQAGSSDNWVWIG
jgi:hypothetical protein